MSSSTTFTPIKSPGKTAMEIQRESSIHPLLNERSHATSSNSMIIVNSGGNANEFMDNNGGNIPISSPEPKGYSNNFLLHYVVDNHSPEAIVDAPNTPPPPTRKTKIKRNAFGAASVEKSMVSNAAVTPTKRSANAIAADDERISRPARKIKLIYNKTDNTTSTILPPESDNAARKGAVHRRSMRAVSTMKKVSFPTLTPEADQTLDIDRSPDLNNDGEEQTDHPDERKGISGRELVASGMGTSTEPALIAPILDKRTGERHKVLSSPWRCGERHCNTGQTWYPRQAVGRKCVSQYFGRNKKETNSIPGDVWNFHCRKHYQRESYSRQFLDTTQKIVAEVNGLRSQVDRLKLWRPDAKFKIQLTKAVHDRLQVFQTAYRRCEGTEDDARNAGEQAWKKKFNIIDERKMQPADKFHPILAEEFGTASLEQEAGSYDDIDRVLEWILMQARANGLTVIPPFELLVLPKENSEVENEISNNYERYMYDVVDKNEGFEEIQVEVETARAVLGPHRQNTRVRDTRPRPLISRITGELVVDRSTFSGQMRPEEEDKESENSEATSADKATANDESMNGVVCCSSSNQPTAIAQMQTAKLSSSNNFHPLNPAASPSTTILPTTTFGAINTGSSSNQMSVKKVRTPKTSKTPRRNSPRRKRVFTHSGIN